MSSEKPLRTGTSPAMLGYKKCHRCGVWRRPEGVKELQLSEAGAETRIVHQCSDDLVCTHLAHVGKGELSGT